MAEAVRIFAAGTVAVFVGMGLVYLAVRLVAAGVSRWAGGGEAKA